jgi:hypothetical protein
VVPSSAVPSPCPIALLPHRFPPLLLQPSLIRYSHPRHCVTSNGHYDCGPCHRDRDEDFSFHSTIERRIALHAVSSQQISKITRETLGRVFLLILSHLFLQIRLTTTHSNLYPSCIYHIYLHETSATLSWSSRRYTSTLNLIHTTTVLSIVTCLSASNPDLGDYSGGLFSCMVLVQMSFNQLCCCRGRIPKL